MPEKPQPETLQIQYSAYGLFTSSGDAVFQCAWLKDPC